MTTAPPGRGYRRLLADLHRVTRLVAHELTAGRPLTLEEARAILARELGPAVASELSRGAGAAAAPGRER